MNEIPPEATAFLSDYRTICEKHGVQFDLDVLAAGYTLTLEPFDSIPPELDFSGLSEIWYVQQFQAKSKEMSKLTTVENTAIRSLAIDSHHRDGFVSRLDVTLFRVFSLVGIASIKNQGPFERKQIEVDTASLFEFAKAVLAAKSEAESKGISAFGVKANINPSSSPPPEDEALSEQPASAAPES